MAIDDQEKRMAVMGVARPWMRAVFPVATPDEEWRISVGHAYGGNALSPVAGGNMFIRLAGPGGGLISQGGLSGHSGGLAG